MSYHCEVILLYYQVAPEAIPLSDAISAAGTMIRCFSTIYLLQCSVSEINGDSALEGRIQLTHPVNWTRVHALCNAGAFLVSSLTSLESSTSSENSWNDVELCISLLSALESNPEFGAAGLSTSLGALMQACKRRQFIV